MLPLVASRLLGGEMTGYPLPGIRNPKQGIHNPRMSWITLQEVMYTLPRLEIVYDLI